jgi:hypothetical protein
MENQEFKVVETRRLATFRTVDRIEPIEGADAIEVAVVGGWKVVVKKNEFVAGDPCIYFEIDSFLPEGQPAWQFLVDKSPRMFNGVKGHKLRTVKLRGQISQGLILPTNVLPQTRLLLCLDENSFLDNVATSGCTEAEIELIKNLRAGMDEHGLDPRDLNLNELLGIVKWDPPLSPQLQGMAAGLFPSFIRKTDQERAQNLSAEIFGYDDVESIVVGLEPHQVDQAALDSGRLFVRDGQVFSRRPGKADRDARYEVTMKLDGSSMTVFARQANKDIETIGDIGAVDSGVCSRNLQLKVNEDNAENTFVKMALKSGLLGVLEDMAAEGIELAVQGELMGPGIQDNREQLKDFKFYVFDIYDIVAGQYLTPEQRKATLKEIVERGARIDHVPIIHENVTLQELGLDTMDKLLAYAVGPSIVHAVREGYVYKKMDGSFSFKTISNKYLEKEKD